MKDQIQSLRQDPSDCVMRQAVIADVDKIHLIESQVFQEPWSKVMIWEEIQRPNGVYLVSIPRLGPAELAEQTILGYGSFYYFEDEAHLTNVAVSPEQQGRGIGKALVACLIRLGINRGVERFTLEVRRSNINAIRLYEKFGFTQEGVRKNYYPTSGEDALIFWSPENGKAQLEQVLEKLELAGECDHER